MHTIIKLLLLLLIAISPVEAADVAVLSHKKLGSVTKLAQLLSEQLQQDVDVRLISEDFSSDSYKAVVLAGPKAVSGWQGKQPAVAVFTSQKVVQQHKAKLASAIFIEPPLARQVRLATTILGRDKPLGILVPNLAPWQQAVNTLKEIANVRWYDISEYQNLNRALVDLLRNNEALIGVYDPELYSSANIKNILITAYRQNKPLIGPSSAYIKAGALATTYSDIPDVAKRLSEILRQGLDTGSWPEPGFNRYFNVRYNEQVGRSLNLLLPPEHKLQEAITQQEAK